MKRSSILLSIVFVLLIAGLATACPMCKDSIPNSDAASATSLPSGYNISVYTLLLGMLGTLGLIIRTLVKGIKN